MTHNGEALSRLRGIRLEDLTQTQLDSVLGTTTLTPATSDQLEQAALLANAVSAQRTNAQGLVIPESGSVVQVVISAGEDYDIQPPGTEIWMITGMAMNGVGGQATGGITYYDGTTQQPIASGLNVTAAGVIIGAYGAVSDVQILNPISLTNSLYWKVLETGASFNIILTFSYHKVSL